MLPGRPGHDAMKPVVGGAGAKPDPGAVVPGAAVIPVAGDSADAAGVVAIGYGVINIGGAIGTAIEIAGGIGLKPPGVSSLDPIGIPARPIFATAAIPPGDDCDAAGFPDADPAVEQP